MRDREDKLLARWCRRGDVEALEELFERAAPRLLKLAIHLAGDPAEAEDLVQATFLAAIEQRERLDASRPALPWLAGVLAHKAADGRRRAARAVDVERLLERESHEDASQPAERAELSGALAEAIDRLEEPYRRVVALRMRHGLAVADVAHVLGRSPGTVRVQLHRGLEKLRGHLPASLASALALHFAAPRGLAAVKAAVLQEAAGAAALAVTTPTVGVWIMSTKTFLAGVAAAALAVFAAVSLWRASDTATIEAETVSSFADGARAAEAPAGSRELDPGLALAPRAEPEPERRPVAGREARPAAASVTGTVVDAASGDPIGGARVRLYAPREVSLLQAVREHPELYEVGTNGVPRPRTHADWPSLGAFSAPARFGAEASRVYDVPESGAEPLAEATTASDGTFSLASDAEGGILVCEREGYGGRVRAASDPERVWVVRMRPVRELAGRVVGTGLEPPGVPLTLVFAALRAPEVTLAEGERYHAFEDSELEGLGVWTAETDADGRFRTRVAADQVYGEVLTEGWRARNIQTYTVSEDVRIVVQPVPVLHFTDAATKKPVERVHLLGYEQRNRYVRWSGEFLAPGGSLTLPGGSGLMQWHAEDTLAFTAWAEGFAASTFTLTEVLAAGVLEVPLEAGSLPALEGGVHRGGRACPGAEVALLGHSPLQWREDEDTLVDAVRPDATGSFRIEAPAGKYILRVEEGGARYFELVQLPAPSRVDLDLDQTGSIAVEVVDAVGLPRPGHTVVLGGADGRNLWYHTDDAGRVAFDDLSPGSFRVMTSMQSAETSFAPDMTESIELARGEQRSVRFELPDAGAPRHARVAARGVTGYTGWRARYDSGPWEPLAPDGTVPMDLATNAFALEIAAPDARRWSVDVPKSAADGHVIRLEGGEAAYRGVLLDGDDAPLAGVRIHATPRAPSSGVSASSVTDAQGRFELAGLEACVYFLQFQDDPEVVSWERSSRFAGTSFLPEAPAGSDTPLEIRLVPAPADVRLHGTVRGADGAPLAGAMLMIRCEQPGPSGTLAIGGDRSIVHSDGEGRFEIRVPRTPQRTAYVYTMPLGGKPVLERTLEDSGLAEEPALELVVP